MANKTDLQAVLSALRGERFSMNAHIPTIIFTLFSVIFIPATIVQIKERQLLGIIVNGMFAFVALLGLAIRIANIGGIFITEESNATIVSAGYHGVCVEYDDRYGKETATSDIMVNNTANYSIGDVVAIEITECIFFNEPKIKIIYVKKADG